MLSFKRARLAGVGVVVLAAVIASTSASAGAATAAAKAAGNRIAIFYYNPSPYGIASLKGAQDEAKKLGVPLDAFDANNDPNAQSTQIQDAITSGKYKAFWVWGLNDIALTPIIKKAEQAGIKVAVADYTWGTLQQQLTLKPTTGFVTTIGQAIGNESTNLIKTMNAACKKQVGNKHCNIAFLPGLANYPTDTVRENTMTAYYKGKSQYTFTIMPPGDYAQATSQKVAQTYFTANRNVNVMATFGDQMAAGALTAMRLVGGYTPGKNIAVIGYGGAQEQVNEVKSGVLFATLGLYPVAESVIGIKELAAALKGKKVPNVVNIINTTTHPAIIDKAYLSKFPKFVPDWTLAGSPIGDPTTSGA
jgi:ABC-type sugar transport system substrate-binding protein